MNKKIGRNDPCPCGSGKKYKNCCLPKDKPSGKKKFSAKLLSAPKGINLIERTYGAAIEASQRKESAPKDVPSPETSSPVEKNPSDQ
jgi:uncharacterized protein